MAEPRARAARLAVAILLLASLLRFAGLDRWPAPIHQDEASNGVDAWSLATTGADRSGRVWPVFLEGFGAGDNRTSLYALLAIPPTWLLGPGTWAARLPAAAAGAGTVLVLFLFLRRIRGTAAAAVGAALLAANPWHVTLSRFGHEASLTPAFLVTALWLVAPGRGERPASAARWAAAGIVLGLGLYSYPSARLFLPAAVALFSLLCLPPGDRRNRIVLVATLAAAALPLAIATAQHPDRLLARAGSASVFGNVEPAGAAILLIGRQYIEHFLPGFLFVRGDGNPLHSPPGGVLLWIDLPLAAAGAVLAVRRRDRWDRAFLAWLLLYPIASATTLGDRPEYVPHSLRAAVGLPVFQILAAQGAGWLYAAGRLRAGAGIARVAAVSLAAAGAAQAVGFAAGFVTSYTPRTAPLFHAAYPPAMRILAENRERFDAALISCEGNHQAYIHALLYRLQSPAEYQVAGKEIDQTVTFHLVRRAGDLFYVHEPEDLDRHLPRLRGTVWALARPGALRVGRLIAEIPLASDPGLEIRELLFESAGSGPDR